MAYPLTIVASSSVVQGTYPLTVSFSVSSLSAGPDTVLNATYSWDFGDGETSNLPAPVHTYNSPGSFIPVVTITGNQSDGNLPVSGFQALAPIDVLNWGTTYNSLDASRCETRIVFATSPTQGVGFTEDNGNIPIVEAEVGVIVVEDDLGYSHTIFHDVTDGYDYDIDTWDGPNGSGLAEEYTDKATSPGNGTAISPVIRFKQDTAPLQHQLQDLICGRLYTEPLSVEKRGATGYDSNGYPTGLLLNFNIYTDNEQITSSVSANNIGLPKQEWLFGRSLKANRTFQAEVVGNMAGFQVTGKTLECDIRDVPADPAARAMSENTYQQNLLTNLKCWISRNNTSACRDVISRQTLSCTHGFKAVAGPNNCTGFAFNNGVDFVNLYTTSGACYVVGWYDGTGSIAGPGGIVHISDIGISGGWKLGLWYQAISGTIGLFGGGWADMRVYTDLKDSPTLLYLLNDVITNSGNNTMPRNYRTQF